MAFLSPFFRAEPPLMQKLEVQGTPSLNCRPFDLHGSSTITSFDCSSTPMRGKTPISIMEMLNPAIETRKGSPSIMSPRTAIFGANRAQLQPPPNTLGWVRSGEEPFPKGWVRTVSRPVDTSKLPPALRQQMIVHDKANTGRTAAIQAGKESTCAEADKQAYVPASILSTITAIGAPSRQLVEMKPMKILSVGANRALLSTILCDSSGNISFPRHVASNLRRSYDCASPVNLHHNEDTGVGESYHRAISESHDRFPDVVAGRGGRNANGMCGVHTFLPERNLLPEPRLESRFLAGILSPQPKRDSRPLTRRSPYLSIPSIDAFMHECSYSDDMNAQVGVTDGFDEDGSRLRSPSAENVSPFLMPHRRLNHSHYTHHESTSEYLKISKQYSEDLLKGSKLSQSQAGRRSSLSKRKPSETGLGNEKMSAIDGTRHDGNVLLEGRETAGKLPFSNRIFTRLSVHRNAAFSDGAFRSDSTMLKVDVMPHVKRMSCPTSKQSIICDMTRRIAVQQKVLIQMASAS